MNVMRGLFSFAACMFVLGYVDLTIEGRPEPALWVAVAAGISSFLAGSMRP
jgi:hypothetical protein